MLTVNLTLYLSYQCSCIFFDRAKLLVHLSLPPDYRPPGPSKDSKYNHLRLSFKDGGQSEVGSASPT